MTAASTSIRPASLRPASRAIITWASFWRIARALSHLTPIWPDSDSVEIESFDCMISHMNWNQRVSGNWVREKMVPATSEVWRRQPRQS